VRGLVWVSRETEKTIMNYNNTKNKGSNCRYKLEGSGSRPKLSRFHAGVKKNFTDYSVQYCLFGTRLEHRSELWLVLEDSLKENGFVIKRIRRVRMQQRNDRRCGVYQYRFDIWVLNDYIDLFLNVIAGNIQFRNTTMKKSVCYWRRCQHHVVIEKQNDLPIVTKFCCWNINGISKKRLEVIDFLNRYHINVLGLTETMLLDHSWPLRIRGYQTFNKFGKKDSEGMRGISLIINNNISSYLVPNVGSENHLFVCAQFQFPVYIGLVYIPVTSHTKVRNVLLQRIKEEVSLLQSKHPVILFGDFNLGNNKLKNPEGIYMKKFGIDELQFEGSKMTFHRMGSGLSALDTILASEMIRNMNCKQYVMDNIDLSDHWPVVAEIPLSTQSAVIESCSFRSFDVDLEKFEQQTELWRNHNRFQSLVDQFEENGNENDLVEESWNSFLVTSQEVLQDLKCLKNKSSGKCNKVGTKLISSKCRSLIKKRRKCWRRLRRLSPTCSDEQRHEIYAEWKNLKLDVRDCMKQDSKRKFDSTMSKGLSLLNTNSGKKFWKWCRSVGIHSASNASSLVMKRTDGSLAMNALEIQDVWFQHYFTLLNTEDDNSLHELLVENNGFCDDVEEYNYDFTADELQKVLSILPNGKAAGRDGIPYELLKGLRVECPLFQFVLQLLNTIWKNGCIPDDWRESVIITIPKGGDPSMTTNYRGISLLSCMLKVLTIILNIRLSKWLEHRNIFVKEQLGFRAGMECIAQAAGLAEICQRRKLCGLSTVVCFLDFATAYDRVPHYKVIEKLMGVGIRGRMIRFLCSLYQKSVSRVATKSGLTEKIIQTRGVRQGCVLSPLLFDVFINDFLCGLGGGVAISGVEENCNGLLYADDSCLGRYKLCWTMHRNGQLIME
jgi:exonuclease III